QHPDLSLGHGGQLLGRCDHPRGDLRLVNGGQQSVVHRYAFSLRVRSVRSRTVRPENGACAHARHCTSISAHTQPPSPGTTETFETSFIYRRSSRSRETRDGHRPCAQQRRNRLETAATSAHLVAPADYWCARQERC